MFACMPFPAVRIAALRARAAEVGDGWIFIFEHFKAFAAGKTPTILAVFPS